MIRIGDTKAIKDALDVMILQNVMAGEDNIRKASTLAGAYELRGVRMMHRLGFEDVRIEDMCLAFRLHGCYLKAREEILEGDDSPELRTFAAMARARLLELRAPIE